MASGCSNTSLVHATEGLCAGCLVITRFGTFLLRLGTVKPVIKPCTTLGPKLNRGGLLIEVKMHCKATIGTRLSGP